jgi:hypothetical protein
VIGTLAATGLSQPQRAAHDGPVTVAAPGTRSGGSGRSGPAIACDESGYEGEKLIGTTTDVFAHASVRMDAVAAADCLRELRDRIRSPALEYKANHLLRARSRPVLEWLLGPSGPLPGNARVYLVDKAFLVVGSVVDVLLGERADAAVTLYRDGPRTFGPEQWETFLVSANQLLRAKDRLDGATPVDSFFRTVEGLPTAGAPVDAVLRQLRQARPRADSYRVRLRKCPELASVLDPLVPAIARAVVHWGSGSGTVCVVHDRQRALSEERIAQLRRASGGLLGQVVLVDSRTDARVQIADVLAGTARKISSDELNNRGDARLTSLLRPYVDPHSIWGDPRSWSRLT